MEHQPIHPNSPKQKHSIGLPWNIHGPVSHGTPWRIDGQYHRKSTGIPMDIHRNTMNCSWSIPWNFHGILEYGYAFVISTMDNPWKTHGFSMYFPWLIHGISSGVLSMAIEKTWVFHEKPMDFHSQYDGFLKYGHAVPWKSYGSDHGFPWNTSKHGFPMSLPCYLDFHGFPMGLQWICSCDF